MTEEHEHEFKQKFYFDPEAKRTIESESCVCGLSRNVRIHH